MLLVFLFAILLSIQLIHSHSTKIIPARLKSGDTIGFISPAYPPYVDVPSYKKNLENLMSQFGLKVSFAPHSFGQYGYFSGTDQERISDIHQMFGDKSIKAIIANRGGWGCNRLIDKLDYNLIKNNPKILVGYSDLTGLINAIYNKTGLVTFHGPMGISDWGSIEVGYFQRVFINKELVTLENEDNFAITTYHGGKSRGKMYGGNLSVFVAMIGSNYLPKPENIGEPYILFLEDVGEQPYSVDRMLTNLHLSGWLKYANGIVFGRCTQCNSTDPHPSFTVDEVLRQRFSNSTVPTFSGAMFGHIDEQYVVPLGTLVEIDANAGTITFLEYPVN